MADELKDNEFPTHEAEEELTNGKGDEGKGDEE